MVPYTNCVKVRIPRTSFATMAPTAPPFSNLDLVNRVDAWPCVTKDLQAYLDHMSEYYHFLTDGYERPFGYTHESFVTQMSSSWCLGWEVDHEARRLTLCGANNFATRSLAMKYTLNVGIHSNEVEELDRLGGELFPLYASDGKHVLDMDGCGVDAFGIVNHSVHMIRHVITADGRKYWVPRRFKTKMSYPNMLDNTVGGSLAAGETPIDYIVRKCQEEISLDPEYTRANIVPCGTASYSMTRTDAGRPGCQHQVQYLDEMEFHQNVVPRIGDGEVQELQLMTLDEVRAPLANGEFKLNCAMTWLSYLFQHGHINAETEEHFVEVCARLHRKHDLFMV